MGTRGGVLSVTARRRGPCTHGALVFFPAIFPNTSKPWNVTRASRLAQASWKVSPRFLIARWRKIAIPIILHNWKLPLHEALRCARGRTDGGRSRRSNLRTDRRVSRYSRCSTILFCFTGVIFYGAVDARKLLIRETFFCRDVARDDSAIVRRRGRRKAIKMPCTFNILRMRSDALEHGKY